MKKLSDQLLNSELPEHDHHVCRYRINDHHYDWDHIWGNCFLKDNNIISHKLCYENIKKYGEEQLKNFKKYKKGKVELILPTILFDNKITLSKDNIEFFHSPGHTTGSASCYDKIDKTLYVGDNLELEVPQLYSNNAEEYLKTLENYLTYDFKTIISGHNLFEDDYILKENINYLKDLLNGKTRKYEISKFKKIHKNNVKMIKS
jgi:glyoxylase-like metal-dependent hydrolase (beta-lactamase superfamily II)